MTSFQQFIEQSRQHQPQPPLNHVVWDYWHDYQTGKPIDGGVAFEPILRKIPLDGSLTSLQVLDKFLDKAKPHLADNLLNISQKTDQRNLLTFIAFYAGLVLTYHASQPTFSNQHALIPSPNWVSFDKLYQTYPPLQRVINNDFSYSLAVSLLPIGDSEQTFVPTVVSDSVYFPLVTIIERLFPQRQSTLTATAPFFGYISDSLFESVSQLLKRWQQLSLEPPVLPVQDFAPNDLTNNLADDLADTQAATGLILATQPSLPNQLLSDLDNPLMERKDWQAVNPSQAVSAHQPVVTHFDFVVPDFADLSMTEDVDDSGTDLHTDESPINLAQLSPTETAIKTAPTENPSVDDIADNPLASAVSEKSKQQTRKKPTQKLDTRSLSSREVIKAAKQQAKDIARQKAEQAAQLAKEAEEKRQAEIAEALANPRINEKLLNQRKSMIDERPVIKDSFSELENDLKNPVLPDSLAENVKTAYAQAMMILDNPQDATHTGKALAVVQKLATANVSDAMLHQALWLLRGREDLGIAQDTAQGIEWVKKAAQLQDSRAEKLLSKLYFSGEIVGINTEQGKYWLAQAAEHGHAEAKRLQQSFALVSTLNETRRDEDDYLKKLAMGVAALLVFALIVIFAVKI